MNVRIPWLSLWRYGLVIVLVLVLDQLSKSWASAALDYLNPIAVTSFFNLTLAHNAGVAFGQLQSLPGGRWVLSFFAIGVCLYLLFWLRSAVHQPWLRCGLALVVGGAVGNLMDRLRLGHVVDFLDFHWQQHHFPSFNVADSAISVGMVLLLWSLFREHPERTS